MKNKFLYAWIQRVAAVLLVFAGSFSSALADTKLYIEDFTIKAGESKKVAVCLDTDLENIGNVTMKVNLPAGLSFVSSPNQYNMQQIQTEPDATRTPKFTVLGSADTKIISVYGNAMNTKPIPAGTGVFCYFYVKETALVGEGTITLSDVSVTTTDYKAVEGVVLSAGTVSKNGGASASGVTMSFAESNITMDAGSSKEIEFNIENSGHVMNMMQADLALPTGWSVSVINSTRGEFTCNYNSNTGLYRLMNVDGLSGAAGVAFTLKLTAPANFVGSAQVSLKDIKFNLDNKTTIETIDDMSLTVTASEVVATKPTVSFGAESTIIGAGKTANVDVNMLNVGQNVLGFQADVIVPEGWSYTLVDGRLAVEDMTVSGKRVIWATPDAVSGVPGEEGALFSLALTTPASFEGEATVKVTNIKVMVGMTKFTLDDITIKVKATDEVAKAAADEIVKALKEKFEGAKANMAAADAETIQGKIAALEADVAAKYKEATLVAADVQAAADAISAEIDAAVEAAAKAAADAKVAELKTAAAALKVSDEAKAYEAENVKAAVAAAEKAIADANAAVAAVEAKIAEGKLATDNKEALAAAVAAAEKAIADAKTAAETAEKTYADQKAADEAAAAAEAAAKAAADAKLVELKAAADALKVSDEAKAYDNSALKVAVAAAEKSIADAQAAVAAVEAKIAEGKLATDNKDALAAAVAAAEKAIADAQATIAAAEKAYADQKAADEAAAEAAAKAAADAKLAELKAAAKTLRVSDEAKAYEAENVKAAVAAAEQAIADAQAAIAAVEAKIAEGKLATDNKEALAEAIAAAEQAIAGADAAVAAAEQTYEDQKAIDDEAAAAEAAAKAAADAKLAELKAAADALKVSDEAKAYDNEDVKAAVAAAEKAIADAQAAVAAVEAKIAEGKLATDNKDALAEAVAAAEKAIADAQAAVAAAEKAYADKKAVDDEAAAAEAAAKAAADAKAAELKSAADALKVSDAAKAYEAENVKAAVADAEKAVAAAQAAVAAVEAKIAEGKLATDNKDALAEAIAAADKAIADANAAVAAAEKVYADQKAADDEAAAAEAAKKAANEAAYARINNQISALQSKLDMAKMTIDASCPDVAEDLADEVAAIQAKIDALKAAADADYAAVALTADSNIDAATQTEISDAIAALVKDAGKAQAAFVANKEAYNRLTSELNDVKEDFADAMAVITDKSKYPDAEANLADDIAAIQKMIDDAAAEIQAGYEAGTLNAESSIDAPAIKKAIADMLEKAKVVAIASIRTVENAETYYDLNGRVLSAPRAGQTVIVRMKDGSTKKVNLR